mgnify:CR=1 FL=1
MLSTEKLPISPRWNPSSFPHFPCGWDVGFQCPPELRSSIGLQSANSWICIELSPGFNPNRCASLVTEDLPLIFSDVTEIFPEILESLSCLTDFLISIIGSIIPLKGTIKVELAITILAAPSLLIEISFKVNLFNLVNIINGI